MTVRSQNLEAIAPVLMTFDIHQTTGTDDLKDTNIGDPVTLTGDNEIGPVSAGDLVLGKLISLTLSDNDDGDRLATVQVGGVCRLAVSATVPSIGDRVVGGTAGTVKQAPTATDVPAGGHIGRGVVLEVNGTTNCIIYLS